VDVYAAVEGIEFAAENAPGKLSARDHGTSAIEKELEEIEFERGKRDACARAANLAGSGIEFDITDAEQRNGGRRLDAAMAAKDGANAGGQLPGIERLGHVIVRAKLEAEDAVHIFSTGGEHDDRDLAGGSNALEDFGAGHGWEHHIKDDEIIFAGKCAAGSFAAVVHGFDVHAFGGEVFPDELGQLAVVIHDKDLFHWSRQRPAGTSASVLSYIYRDPRSRRVKKCKARRRGRLQFLTAALRALTAPEAGKAYQRVAGRRKAEVEPARRGENLRGRGREYEKELEADVGNHVDGAGARGNGNSH
jgi:hypothetical protein